MAVKTAGAGSVYRPSLENVRSLGNFSQTFRWSVQFVTWPMLITNAVASGISSWYTNLSNDNLNFRAESFQIPNMEVETTEITIRGQTVRQAGKATYTSPITFTLNETIDGFVQDFLSAWQELTWRSQDGSWGITRYKPELECNINLYLLDNMDRPYYLYHLIGCQVANGEKGDPSADDGSPFKPNLSIAYDYFTKSNALNSSSIRKNKEYPKTPADNPATTESFGSMVSII